MFLRREKYEFHPFRVADAAQALCLDGVPAVLIGGIGTILVVLIWVRIFPQLAHTGTLDQ
jgi:hypothetical protein